MRPPVAGETVKVGTIKINPGSETSYSVELQDGDTLQIGRKSMEGVKNLVLPAPEVSVHHAEIRCNPEKWILVDHLK
ncbi:MAG: FHA domain-containing protein [Cyanobacteria bacterium]|nr:FHA domain-containing protein [Cyanobacteriota bacterium]